MKNLIVSVPSRGVRYLNRLDAIQREETNRRFRPLSGSKVSEQARKTARERVATSSFRPLSGSKVSELTFVSLLIKLIPYGFRPLSGSKVSERGSNESYLMDKRFPSPLGE